MRRAPWFKWPASRSSRRAMRRASTSHAARLNEPCGASQRAMRRVSTSGEAGEEVGDGGAGAGVEGHLLAHVEPCLGASEVSHQVDDARQVVGLEGEHPLVVAEGEAGDRVGPD